MSTKMKWTLGIVAVIVVIVILYYVFGRKNPNAMDPLSAVLGPVGITPEAIEDAKGYKANFPEKWSNSLSQAEWDGFGGATKAAFGEERYSDVAEQVAGFLKGMDIRINGWAVTQLLPHIQKYVEQGGKGKEIVKAGQYLA